MAYGCKIYDQYGNITLDTTDYTARLVYQTVKAGDSSGSVYIPEANGKIPYVLIYPTTSNINMLVVSITPSGTLSWNATYNSAETGIMVYVCNERV